VDRQCFKNDEFGYIIITFSVEQEAQLLLTNSATDMWKMQWCGWLSL